MDDGVLLMADVFGGASGPTVLLLHGAGQTRHAWRSTALMLSAAGYGTVSVDLRGHGESDWSHSGDYALTTLANDVLTVLKSLPDDIVVVGASVGGIASLIALGEQPAGNAIALVLVDIVARIDPDGADEVITFMRANPEGFSTVDAAADAVAAYLPHRRRPSSLAGLSRNLRLGSDGKYHWHWDPRFLDARVSEAEQRSVRMAAAARKLDLPVLLVRGGGSRIVTEAGVQEMLNLVPSAKLVNIPDADHMVAGDSNDAFNVPLLQFIDSLGAARPPSSPGQVKAGIVTPGETPRGA